MGEGEAKVTRLYLCFIRHFENRFETDALLADVCLWAMLGASTNIAYCREMFPGEAIFVAFDGYVIGIDLEKDERLFSSLSGFRKFVVLAILQQLEHKSGRIAVQVFRQAVFSSKSGPKF